LAEKVKLGAVPGSSFFREPVHRYIRFHFAKGDDRVLEDAISRLSKIHLLQK
jgi:aspartate/methionine/tyrosine aminotransferase